MNIIWKDYRLWMLVAGLSLLGAGLLSRRLNYYIDRSASRLDNCLVEAEREHWSTWSLNCESYGSNIEKDDSGTITACSLPSSLAESIDDTMKEDKDRCVKIYK